MIIFVLLPNMAKAQQSGVWRDSDGRSYRSVTRPVVPDYRVKRRAERPSNLRWPDSASPRRTVTRPEPLRLYRSSVTPFIIDIDGKQCQGFGRLFPLMRAGNRSYGGVSPQSSPDRDLRRLGRTMSERGSGEADRQGDSDMPAGYTFLAQFIDHDITFDTTSMLNVPIEDDELRNARTVDLDLDSVYGGGAEETPYLYRLPYLRVGRTVLGDGHYARFDLLRAPKSERPGPRGGEARALIGDPRNDENFVLAQLHAAFIAFHNRVVDILIERRHGSTRRQHCRRQRLCDTHHLAAKLPRATRKEIFEAARDHVIHYYHRVIVEDFLPRLIGPNRVRDLLARGRDFYFPNGFVRERHRATVPFIPVEFAVGAFRYGHSQVRESYWLRDSVRKSLFDRGGSRNGLPAFKPLRPDLVVDWQLFFEIGRGRPHGFNFARKIDTEIARPLQNLAAFNIVGQRDLGSLAARNLSRGRTLRLPSGQVVADRILRVLHARGSLNNWRSHRLASYGDRASPWMSLKLQPDRRIREILGSAEAPLWYYVLQEAAAFGARTGAGADSLYLSNDERYAPRRYASTSMPGNYLIRRTRARDEPYRYQNSYYGDPRHTGTLGHTLGPVGGTIVGEVLLGLVDHYREKTGKGLGFRPEVRASLRRDRHAPFSLTGRHDFSGDNRPRYMMRNLLIDAGLANRVIAHSNGLRDCLRGIEGKNCRQNGSTSALTRAEPYLDRKGVRQGSYKPRKKANWAKDVFSFQ